MVSRFRRSVVVTCGVAMLLTGCATVPLASKADDQRAKEFKAPDSKCRVYCYRPYKFAGSAIKLPVILNGKRRVELAPNTFTYFDVPPGPHTVATFSRDPVFGTVFPIKLNIQPGEVIFLWHGSKVSGGGFAARLIREDEEVAKRKMRGCRLVQATLDVGRE